MQQHINKEAVETFLGQPISLDEAFKMAGRDRVRALACGPLLYLMAANNERREVPIVRNACTFGELRKALNELRNSDR